MFGEMRRHLQQGSDSLWVGSEEHSTLAGIRAIDERCVGGVENSTVGKHAMRGAYGGGTFRFRRPYLHGCFAPLTGMIPFAQFRAGTIPQYRHFTFGMWAVDVADEHSVVCLAWVTTQARYGKCLSTYFVAF